MNHQTLIKLAKNPRYNMSDTEIEMLHKYQQEEWGKRKPKRKKKTYKHDSAFQVHVPGLPFSDSDNLTQKRDARGRGSQLN